jgi:hypothetical protein
LEYLVSQSTPSYLHDIPADWQAPLAYGSNKSAKPGEWKNRSYTLDSLIRALTQHNIGPKDGPCFLQGYAKGGTRQAKAMERLSVIGIDVDNGMPSTEIDEIVRDRGLFCIRYTTHSHGKDYTEVRKDDWIKYLRANEGATLAEYLVAKKRYLPEIAALAQVTAEEFTADGMTLTVSHPAMDKNRLVFVLAKPWNIRDYDLGEEGMKAWKDAYMSFAAWLGIVVDKSCTDPSRLFYLPRHDSDGLYEAVVHQGSAVDIFSIPKTQPSRQSTGNVFLDAASAMGAADDNRTMRSWAAKFGDRFLIADALEEHNPSCLRPEKDRESVRHIECPFEAGHTHFGGSGTFMANAGETTHGGFVIKCQHDSCSDRDRLDFLCEMVKQEWLPEEALTDDAFLIEIEEEDPPAPLVEAPEPIEQITMADVKDAASADVYVRGLAESDVSPIRVAEELNQLARRLRDDLGVSLDRATLQAAYKAHAKTFKQTQEAAREAAERHAKDGGKAKRAAEKDKEKHAKNAARDKRREDALSAEENRVSIFVDTDHLKSVQKALEALRKYNAANPFIFRNAGSLVRIVWDEQGYPRIERMGAKELTFELARVTRYLEEKGEAFKEVPPTPAVVADILANPDTQFPVLSGIVTAPVFGPDGKINTKPGYDPSSQLYFEPAGGLKIQKVSEKPTSDDVAKSLDLLMGNALVDFPFDGPNGGQSERAHALCMILQPFARQLIDGATPIYLIVKPTPGTGASKLVNIYSLLSSGEEAVAQTETRSEDEIRKRITSVLIEGSPTFYLDNINYRIDSSALASAVTTTMWTDRLLGETKTVKVPVKHTWIFAGNNPTMSNEIARRCVRVRLDAKVERPELRNSFKHKDLEGWVRANRAELIWACLTLIQYWIAKGKPEGEANKGSFEPWSRVMGGILKCCGYTGFLANDSELRDASDEEGNGIKTLISAWWQRFNDQPATVGGPADGLFDLYKDEEIALPITGTHPDQQKLSFSHYVGKLSGRIFAIEDDNGDKFSVRIEKSNVKKGNKVHWRLARIQ